MVLILLIIISISLTVLDLHVVSLYPLSFSQQSFLGEFVYSICNFVKKSALHRWSYCCCVIGCFCLIQSFAMQILVIHCQNLAGYLDLKVISLAALSRLEESDF